MQLIRWLLFPFTILYTLIILIRNMLYDASILKSTSFSVKTIVIGNLAIGGAGKSPLTQLLISYFQDKYRLATLSRGYGRSTKGFRIVNLDDQANIVGDEPLQFKNNYPNITVAVDENRVEGITKLQKDHNLILLDDAFQHRKLKPTCSILLFDFNSILQPIILLPTGNYRDSFNQVKRASIILITKCPQEISKNQKNIIEKKIRRYNVESPIFYSTIKYHPAIAFNKEQQSNISLLDSHILLFTGIANPEPLKQYLKANSKSVEHIEYRDHHNFSIEDFYQIKKQFKDYPFESKIIITTEKDIQRIPEEAFQDYPLYYIPISTEIENLEYFLTKLERTVN